MVQGEGVVVLGLRSLLPPLPAPLQPCSEAHKLRLLCCAELEGVLHGPQVAVVVKVGGVVRAAHAGPARQGKRVA